MLDAERDFIWQVPGSWGEAHIRAGEPREGGDRPEEAASCSPMRTFSLLEAWRGCSCDLVSSSLVGPGPLGDQP